MDTRGFCPGVNWAGLEFDHSPPQVPRLRTSGAVALLPIYAFKAWTATILPLHTVGHLNILHIGSMCV
jgi:hypothetical protein